MHFIGVSLRQMENKSYTWIFYVVGSLALVAVGAFTHKACRDVVTVQNDTVTIAGDTITLTVERWRVRTITQTAMRTDTIEVYYGADEAPEYATAIADTVLERRGSVVHTAGEVPVTFLDRVVAEYERPNGPFRLEFLDAPIIIPDETICPQVDGPHWGWYVVAVLAGSLAGLLAGVAVK